MGCIVGARADVFFFLFVCEEGIQFWRCRFYFLVDVPDSRSSEDTVTCSSASGKSCASIQSDNLERITSVPQLRDFLWRQQRHDPCSREGGTMRDEVTECVLIVAV